MVINKKDEEKINNTPESNAKNRENYEILKNSKPLWITN